MIFYKWANKPVGCYDEQTKLHLGKICHYLNWAKSCQIGRVRSIAPTADWHCVCS